MSDCIFNGTVKRPPMGLAEVTITMEDPELAEAARFVIEGTTEESQEKDSEESQSAQSLAETDGILADGQPQTLPQRPERISH